MTRSINNRKEVLLSLELPQRNINSNTTLTLSLHLIQHPSVFERTLTNIVSFLLKTLNCTLINTSTSINQMTSSCRLSWIDVTNHNKVNMRLLLTHLIIITSTFITYFITPLAKLFWFDTHFHGYSNKCCQRNKSHIHILFSLFILIYNHWIHSFHLTTHW